MSKTIAMIPARMGSKRVPKKNIRLLNGTPLISYIIRAAKESGCFDEIYVNSELGVGAYKEAIDTGSERFMGASQKYPMPALL